MDKIFHVYATNGPDRDAELSLPATPYQIQDAFDKLRLEPGKLPYLDILDYAILILACDILTLTRLKSELHFAFLI